MKLDTLSRGTLLACLSASFIAVATMAWAHSGMTGIVKDRMELMMDIGRQMKTVGEMLKGNAALEHATIKAAAQQIGAHAGKITELFPAGSLDKPTEASPEIWQNWDQFAASADELESASTAMAEIGEQANRNEIAQRFGAIGKTCSGCHEAFRIKK